MITHRVQAKRSWQTRAVLVSLLSAALAIALIGPSTSQAAPTVDTPSGEALVRIDGGTAITRKQSQLEYRIVAPAGARISWFGEVAGKGARVGAFTPKALIAAWQGLGHRRAAGGVATLTWIEPGAKQPMFAAAALSKPRLNKAGMLTFSANVNRPLPKRMQSFSINVARAGQSTREFPTYGPCFLLLEDLCVYVMLNSPTDGQAGWDSSNGTSDECQPPTPLRPGYINIREFVCNEYHVAGPLADGSASYFEWDGSTNQVSGEISIRDAVFDVFFIAAIFISKMGTDWPQPR